jgi:NitT/TauT family transport system substrate-binding protein
MGIINSSAFLATLLFVLLFTGCGGKKETSSSGNLQKVTLQLDWYAEPAHGGFYQAVIRGFYADEGLDVEIVQGGPGAVPLQSITAGKADFTLRRIDDAILGIARGLPLQVIMAYMQKDPQAIMFHASNPIHSWEDLNGKAIMVEPASSFVAWLKKYHGIQFDVIPVDYGIQRFLSDENFIQQCFITSQPFFAKQQGAEVKTLLLSDSGFSPERVVISNRSLTHRNSDLVAAFVRASIRGWRDYMGGDPTETHALLPKLNPANVPELNEFSHAAMKDYMIVEGDPAKGEALGLVRPEKLTETLKTLYELELIPEEIALSRVIDYSILPAEVGQGPGSN